MYSPFKDLTTKEKSLVVRLMDSIVSTGITALVYFDVMPKTFLFVTVAFVMKERINRVKEVNTAITINTPKKNNEVDLALTDINLSE